MFRIVVGVLFLAAGILAVPNVVPQAHADSGCYIAASGDCVERPDSSTSNVTAVCGDGTNSHSESRSGTCSRHGGVSQWCPCGGTAAAPTAPSAASPSETNDGGYSYVALAIAPRGDFVGSAWDAPTLEAADQAALAQCLTASGLTCQIGAWGVNGCVAVAFDGDTWAGAFGPDAAGAGTNALDKLAANGTVAAVRCSTSAGS